LSSIDGCNTLCVIQQNELIFFLGFVLTKAKSDTHKAQDNKRQSNLLKIEIQNFVPLETFKSTLTKTKRQPKIILLWRKIIPSIPGLTLGSFKLKAPFAVHIWTKFSVNIPDSFACYQTFGNFGKD